MRFVLILSAILLGACGGADVAPSSPAESMQTDAVSHDNSESDTPVAEAPVARDASCTAANLDLDATVSSDLCRVERTGDDLPASIAVIGQTSADAVGGRTVPIHIQLHNTSAAPVELYLDASCSFTNLIKTRIFTGHNQRVDRVGEQDCQALPSCTGEVIHVTLLADGKANLHYGLATRVAVADQSCSEMTGRAFEAGKYRAEVRVGDREPFNVKLAVTREQFLPVAECASYAKDLAKRAEPSKDLQPQVAATVRAQCQKNPPTMKLVKCQRAAENEVALQKCQALDIR